MIVWKGRERLGLAVDGLMATQEIVIKPLSKVVKENRYFSGSTIIGSGEVVLILDVANLLLTRSAAPGPVVHDGDNQRRLSVNPEQALA